MKIKLSQRAYSLAAAMILAAALPASGLTVPPTLRDEMTGSEIWEGARNLVICIHGWNNPVNPNHDRYSENEWSDLVTQLKSALPKTGNDPWELLLYHWEDDAATGFIDWYNPLNENPVANANQAAAFAWLHGVSLGPRLPSSLRRVQIVAHSAGAWAAQQAALSLLEYNRFVIVQITLLDPYVPGRLGNQTYTVSELNDLILANFLYSGRVSLLENYYADDRVSWNSAVMPSPTFGTEGNFSWGTDDINQKVEWGSIIVAPLGFRSPTYLSYYQWHSGPISFFADTVRATLGNPPASLPTGSPYNYQQRGWYRSLYYRTQQGQLPRITAQPLGQDSTESSVILSVTASGSGPFTYQWFKNNSLIIGANNSTHTVNSSTDPPTPYVVRVTDANGKHIFSDRAVVTFYSAPPPPPTAPTVASVLPSTLTGLPLPQTQLLRIIGSGFTASSTLLFNGSIASDAARLHFISANEIDYDIRTDIIAANWSVKVINGAQQSNLGYFTVVAPTPNTGSLTINLSPVGAVSAGAQWRVDGGSYRNTGDTATALTPGSHTVSFKSVSGFTTPADKSVTIASGATTTDSGSYSVITPSTYTLTLNYDPAQGGASPSPLVPQTSSTYGSYSFGYTAGSTTLIQASASTGYHFTGWSGDASGTANPTTITMNGNKSVTANFASGDPNLGTMILTIQPPEAAAAGVQWGWNVDDYRISGTSVTVYPGTFIFTIHPVDGWLGPIQRVVTITAGQTTNVTVTFTQDTTPGLLTVTLSPPDAVTAGAHWRVNGGAAQGSGATVSLPPGNGYNVTFDSAPGWIAPPSQTVQVQRAQTRVVAGSYTPPVGQPVIAAIHPSFGALAGGTALTIEGVNFTAPANVLIGGKPATNVVVLSSLQIACLTPSNSVYGTVPVVVQTTGGNATNGNGFSYGVERGNGIELVSAIGGSVNAVAVQGNYAYVGEGSSLMVVGVSNPASPSPVGRLAMPGMVNKVALSGQYAFVANDDAGLQVVDVSTPSVPKLVGFFDTVGISAGITIAGTNAFVADGDGGLLIFDISIPKSPILLSAMNVGGSAQDVSVNGGFAYVVFPGTLVIVGVTNLRAPILRGQITLPDSISRSLAVSGSRVFVANADGGLRIIDVSNPGAPTDLGRAPSVVYPVSVAVSGNLVFSGSAYNSFAVSSYSGGTMTFLGAAYGVGSGSYSLAVAGSRVYVPGGAKGFSIVDVSTPASPTLSGSFSSQAGAYGWVSLSGNYLYTCVDGAVNGLRIFDVSNPALPIKVGQYDGIGDSSGQVLVTNGVAYVDDFGAKISILNVANPALPSLLHTIPVTTIYTNKMGLSGNILFVAGSDTSFNGKFAVFDVSAPSSPIQRGQISFASADQTPLSMAVNGNKAVVGFDSQKLKILDVSNINAPVVVGSLTNIGSPIDIAMSMDGHFAFVAAAYMDAFLVVDVSNPANPVQIASVPLASRPVRLCVRDNVVYVAGFVGVLAFDVSVPSSPVLTRFYAAPSRGGSQGYGISVVRDLVHSRDIIYTGDYVAGLVVLQTKDTEAPNIQITSPTVLPSFTNTTGNLNLAGSASDNGSITRVTWSNSRGGGGDAGGTNSWFVGGIALQPGTNILTATAFDQAGNSTNDTLIVIYQSPKQSQTITFPALAGKTFGEAPITLAAAASSGLAVSFSVLSGPATVSNNALTLTGAGVVAVRAAQSGNDSFNAAPAVTNSFNVAKAGQAISFAPPSDKSVGAAPFAVNATASSSLPVTLSIVSGPATVGSNVVTLTGAGIVAVRASQSGNTNFNAALDVDRSFVVAKLPQFITFGALSRQVFGDAPFALSASASSGLPVSFSILSGPAIVSGKILTMTGTGLVVLRASQSGDATNAPAPNVDQVLIVVPGNNVITDFQRLANGMFTFRFYGEPGSNYVVQASTNLVNWLALATNQVSGLGYLEFTDAAATNYSKRFYRIAPLSALIPSGPVLTLMLVGNNVVVSWATNDIGFTLETATNLPPTSWTLNYLSPAIVNGKFTVTNPVSGGTRFYRLKK